MQNEAQYDLDRKAAKISALSSNNLDKYEYLTGEDLGLKPSTVEHDKMIKKKVCLKGQKILKIKMKSSYKHLKNNEKNN